MLNIETVPTSGFRLAMMIESVKNPPSCPFPPYHKSRTLTFPFSSFFISVPTVFVTIAMPFSFREVQISLNPETILAEKNSTNMAPRIKKLTFRMVCAEFWVFDSDDVPKVFAEKFVVIGLIK